MALLPAFGSCGREKIICREIDDCLADAEISGYVDELLGLGVIAEPEQVIRCIEGNCRHGPFCLSSWDDICAAFGAEAEFWCEYLNEEDGLCRYLDDTACRVCAGSDGMVEDPEIVDAWWSDTLGYMVEAFTCVVEGAPEFGECLAGRLMKNPHP